MSKITIVLGVLLAFSNTMAAPRNYPEEGPFYEAPYLVTGPAVQLRQMWMAAGSDQVVRKSSFLAPVVFQTASPNEKEGRVVFERPRRVLDDNRAGIWTRLVVVRGTNLLVQVQTDFKRRVVVSVLDPAGGRRELANLPNSGQNPEDGACALTRSGRHALVVRPDKVSLWDVANWREEKVEGEKNLLAIRTALVKGTGSAGNWWLTDDLRYIVADTTRTEWDAEFGEGPVYAAPFDIGGVKLDVAKDAMVFDRKTGRLSAFESSIPSPVLGTFKIADVESVAGTISLLYALNIRDLHVAIADTAGHVRASHAVDAYTARLAAWDPEHDDVWIQMRDSTNSLPDYHPDADHHLIVWNAAKDTERRFRVTVEQMRKAVENAK
jgi:hypothetical protein